MAQTVASPGSESALLRRRLAALRHRLLLVIVVRGLGWLLTALLAGALACGLLDWRWHLPSSVRAVFLVGTLAAAGCLAYRYLFLPLSARLDDLALALRIEEHYDQLNDALASTVEFLREPPDSEQFGSPSLRREAVRRALRRAQDCDFGRVIDRRGLHLAGALALLLGSGAVTLAVLHPTLARTALLRLVHPFGGFEWPKQTLLEIDPPRERIGRNEPFEVRGRIRGVIPEQVTVLFKLDDSQTIEHACAVQRAPAPFPHEGEGKGEGAGTFATVLKPGQARREIRFRVQANDAVSPGPDRWYRVVVLPPPSLAPLDGRASPQVRLRPPAYTDLPVQDLPDGIGDIETVAGTHVTLRAAADRPLARAWIEYEPEPPFVGLAAFLAPLASRHAAGTAALAAAGREVWGEVRAELSADRQTFAAAFVPRASGRYLLNFEDDSGLRNSRLFELRVLADPPPLVNLDRPSDKRDILSVLPTAELPLQALVEDPQFAVRSAWLEYRTRPGDQPPAASLDPVHRLPLYDHQVAGAEAWGPFARLVPPLRLREKRVEIDRRLSLAKLPGIRLREGDLLILQVCADDFDDVDFTKPPGRSHEVEVRIISRDTLDLILTQQQAEVQKELLRLREQEREAIKKVAEVQARLRKLGRLDDEDLGQLQQTEQLQEQIRERIGSRRQEGLRREVARILETLQNNQLPRSAVHERMEQV
ncbi:MAG TPA: hypothetical protein VNK04_05870, partial [Gemmataceae bacterium]|nr:hypothetical protein [Gemmataceae bacterium]